MVHRDRTGRGQFIDSPLQENCAAFFAEPLLHHIATGNVVERRGNRNPRSAPQGCYPSHGDDMWMVLCVREDDDWRRLREVIGAPELEDARFDTLTGRLRHHDEIDRHIEAWSRRYDHNEAAAILQQAWIPAAPVLANWEMISNPHYFERGFYIPVHQKETGCSPIRACPGTSARLPPPAAWAAPASASTRASSSATS